MAQNIIEIRNLPYLSNVDILSNLRGNASALSLAGNFNISGNLSARSLTLTSINSTGNLSGDAITANVGAFNNVSTQYLSVSVDASVANVLSVPRIRSLNPSQPLYIDADCFITGNLIASRQIEVQSSNVTISNTIGVGVLMPTQAVDVLGSIQASGNALFGGHANIGTYVRVGTDLTVIGNSSLQKNLAVGGTTLLNDLTASNASITALTATNASVSGLLSVTGPASFVNANVTNALSVSGPLTAAGSVSVSGAFHANGSADFVNANVSGSLSVNGALNAANANITNLTIAGPLSAANNVSVAGLFSAANANLSGTLTVQGAAQFNQTLTANANAAVKGTITANSTQYGATDFNYVEVSNGNVFVVTNRIARSLFGTAWLGNASSIAVNHGLNLSPNIYSVSTTFCDVLPSDQLVTVSVTEKVSNSFVISCIPYNASNTASVDFMIHELAPITGATIP